MSTSPSLPPCVHTRASLRGNYARFSTTQHVNTSKWTGVVVVTPRAPPHRIPRTRSALVRLTTTCSLNFAEQPHIKGNGSWREQPQCRKRLFNPRGAFHGCEAEAWRRRRADAAAAGEKKSLYLDSLVSL